LDHADRSGNNVHRLLLLQGEPSVACLAELAGATPTAVSQHLAKLRLADLVKGRREGTFVYYSAANDHAHRPLKQARFHADRLDRDLPTEPATPPADRASSTP
jgi:DNA-binding transcriptional ArsR family regulator